MTSDAILLIEDEPHIRKFLKNALQADGYQVFEADSVARGLIEAASRVPQLCLLDLGLPDEDGMGFIQELRSWSAMPILVLSARDRESDKVNALNIGADDYLTKPFGIEELLARVRAQLRRSQPKSSGSRVEFGDVDIDLAKRMVRKAGQDVHLTKIEYRLLSVLLEHADQIMTHVQLLNAVWGPNHQEHEHYVRIYMANLRQKLEDQPTQPRYLLTEIGMGYRLCLGGVIGA
ncbi:MAG: response regulator [Pseudomonadota bacterium]|nr:response regulator [Pseudomonadota bacterium]